MAYNKSKYKYIMVMDLETSGICMNQIDPSHNDKTGDSYQIVSGGFIVVDSDTLDIKEELYLEIKWNRESIWDDYAEKIHGLTPTYLEKNGITEEEAVIAIGNLIVKYFGNTCVNFMGHNVMSFDIPFLKYMFDRVGVPLNFSHRAIDTNTLGYAVFDTYDSNQLFDMVNIQRGHHNALEDAKASLKVTRIIRKLCKEFR